MKRSKVFLSGWFCQGNSGDDALLTAVSSMLGNSSANITSYLHAGFPQYLPPLFSPMVLLSLKRRFKGEIFLRHLVTLWRTHIIVWGGGSTMSDVDEAWLSSLRYQRLITRFARWRGIPMFFYALGLGPFRTEEGRKIAREILDSAEMVLVRDSESYALCNKLGVSSIVIRSFDPAILIPNLLNKAGTSAKRMPSKPLRLGISMAKSLGTFSNTLEDQKEKLLRFVEVMRRVALRLEIEVVSIQMCANPRNNDLELCQKLNSALEGICPVSTLHYRPNPGEMMNEISSLDGLVAERLHAGIFAYATGIPFAIIPYHDKCLAFARDVKLPDCCLLNPMLSGQGLENFIDLLSRNPDQCQPVFPIHEAKRIVLSAENKIIRRLGEIVVGST